MGRIDWVGIHFKIPRDWRESLHFLAAQRGQKVSDLLRELVRQHLNSEAAAANFAELSAIEAAREVADSLKSALRRSDEKERLNAVVQAVNIVTKSLDERQKSLVDRVIVKPEQTKERA